MSPKPKPTSRSLKDSRDGSGRPKQVMAAPHDPPAGHDAMCRQAPSSSEKTRRAEKRKRFSLGFKTLLLGVRDAVSARQARAVHQMRLSWLAAQLQSAYEASEVQLRKVIELRAADRKLYKEDAKSLKKAYKMAAVQGQALRLFKAVIARQKAEMIQQCFLQFRTNMQAEFDKATKQKIALSLMSKAFAMPHPCSRPVSTWWRSFSAIRLAQLSNEVEELSEALATQEVEAEDGEQTWERRVEALEQQLRDAEQRCEESREQFLEDHKLEVRQLQERLDTREVEAEELKSRLLQKLSSTVHQQEQSEMQLLDAGSHRLRRIWLHILHRKLSVAFQQMRMIHDQFRKAETKRKSEALVEQSTAKLRVSLFKGMALRMLRHSHTNLERALSLRVVNAWRVGAGKDTRDRLQLELDTLELELNEVVSEKQVIVRQHEEELLAKDERERDFETKLKDSHSATEEQKIEADDLRNKCLSKALQWMVRVLSQLTIGSLMISVRRWQLEAARDARGAVQWRMDSLGNENERVEMELRDLQKAMEEKCLGLENAVQEALKQNDRYEEEMGSLVAQKTTLDEAMDKLPGILAHDNSVVERLCDAVDRAQSMLASKCAQKEDELVAQKERMVDQVQRMIANEEDWAAQRSAFQHQRTVLEEQVAAQKQIAEASRAQAAKGRLELEGYMASQEQEMQAQVLRCNALGERCSKLEAELAAKEADTQSKLGMLHLEVATLDDVAGQRQLVMHRNAVVQLHAVSRRKERSSKLSILRRWQSEMTADVHASLVNQCVQMENALLAKDEKQQQLAKELKDAHVKIEAMEREVQQSAELHNAMKQVEESMLVKELQMAVARAEAVESEVSSWREVVESKERTIGGLEGEVKKVHEEMEAFSKSSGSEREAMLAQELSEASAKALAVGKELEECRTSLRSAEEAAASAERAIAEGLLGEAAGTVVQQEGGRGRAGTDPTALSGGIGDSSAGDLLEGRQANLTARDDAIRRLEDAVAKAEAEKGSVVAASGSEREQVLMAQASESSEKVLELEKQLEESAEKLGRALKAGAEVKIKLHSTRAKVIAQRVWLRLKENEAQDAAESHSAVTIQQQQAAATAEQLKSRFQHMASLSKSKALQWMVRVLSQLTIGSLMISVRRWQLEAARDARGAVQWRMDSLGNENERVEIELRDLQKAMEEKCSGLEQDLTANKQELNEQTRLKEQELNEQIKLMEASEADWAVQRAALQNHYTVLEEQTAAALELQKIEMEVQAKQRVQMEERWAKQLEDVEANAKQDAIAARATMLTMSDECRELRERIQQLEKASEDQTSLIESKEQEVQQLQATVQFQEENAKEQKKQSDTEVKQFLDSANQSARSFFKKKRQQVSLQMLQGSAMRQSSMHVRQLLNTWRLEAAYDVKSEMQQYLDTMRWESDFERSTLGEKIAGLERQKLELVDQCTGLEDKLAERDMVVETLDDLMVTRTISRQQQAAKVMLRVAWWRHQSALLVRIVQRWRFHERVAVHMDLMRSKAGNLPSQMLEVVSMYNKICDRSIICDNRDPCSEVESVNAEVLLQIDRLESMVRSHKETVPDIEKQHSAALHRAVSRGDRLQKENDVLSTHKSTLETALHQLPGILAHDNSVVERLCDAVDRAQSTLVDQCVQKENALLTKDEKQQQLAKELKDAHVKIEAMEREVQQSAESHSAMTTQVIVTAEELESLDERSKSKAMCWLVQVQDKLTKGSVTALVRGWQSGASQDARIALQETINSLRGILQPLQDEFAALQEEMSAQKAKMEEQGRQVELMEEECFQRLQKVHQDMEARLVQQREESEEEVQRISDRSYDMNVELEAKIRHLELRVEEEANASAQKLGEKEKDAQQRVKTQEYEALQQMKEIKYEHQREVEKLRMLLEQNEASLQDTIESTVPVSVSANQFDRMRQSAMHQMRVTMASMQRFTMIRIISRLKMNALDGQARESTSALQWRFEALSSELQQSESEKEDLEEMLHACQHRLGIIEDEAQERLRVGREQVAEALHMSDCDSKRAAEIDARNSELSGALECAAQILREQCSSVDAARTLLSTSGEGMSDADLVMPASTEDGEVILAWPRETPLSQVATHLFDRLEQNLVAHNRRMEGLHVDLMEELRSRFCNERDVQMATQAAENAENAEDAWRSQVDAMELVQARWSMRIGVNWLLRIDRDITRQALRRIVCNMRAEWLWWTSRQPSVERDALRRLHATRVQCRALAWLQNVYAPAYTDVITRAVHRWWHQSVQYLRDLQVVQICYTEEHHQSFLQATAMVEMKVARTRILHSQIHRSIQQWRTAVWKARVEVSRMGAAYQVHLSDKSRERSEHLQEENMQLSQQAIETRYTMEDLEEQLAEALEEVASVRTRSELLQAQVARLGQENFDLQEVVTKQYHLLMYDKTASPVQQPEGVFVDISTAEMEAIVLTAANRQHEHELSLIEGAITDVQRLEKEVSQLQQQSKLTALRWITKVLGLIRQMRMTHSLRAWHSASHRSALSDFVDRHAQMREIVSDSQEKMEKARLSNEDRLTKLGNTTADALTQASSFMEQQMFQLVGEKKAIAMRLMGTSAQSMRKRQMTNAIQCWHLQVNRSAVHMFIEGYEQLEQRTTWSQRRLTDARRAYALNWIVKLLHHLSQDQMAHAVRTWRLESYSCAVTVEAKQTRALRSIVTFLHHASRARVSQAVQVWYLASHRADVRRFVEWAEQLESTTSQSEAKVMHSKEELRVLHVSTAAALSQASAVHEALTTRLVETQEELHEVQMQLFEAEEIPALLRKYVQARAVRWMGCSLQQISRQQMSRAVQAWYLVSHRSAVQKFIDGYEQLEKASSRAHEEVQQQTEHKLKAETEERLREVHLTTGDALNKASVAHRELNSQLVTTETNLQELQDRMAEFRSRETTLKQALSVHEEVRLRLTTTEKELSESKAVLAEAVAREVALKQALLVHEEVRSRLTTTEKELSESKAVLAEAVAREVALKQALLVHEEVRSRLTTTEKELSESKAVLAEAVAREVALKQALSVHEEVRLQMSETQKKLSEREGELATLHQVYSDERLAEQVQRVHHEIARALRWMTKGVQNIQREQILQALHLWQLESHRSMVRAFTEREKAVKTAIMNTVQLTDESTAAQDAANKYLQSTLDDALRDIQDVVEVSQRSSIRWTHKAAIRIQHDMLLHAVRTWHHHRVVDLQQQSYRHEAALREMQGVMQGPLTELITDMQGTIARARFSSFKWAIEGIQHHRIMAAIISWQRGYIGDLRTEKSHLETSLAAGDAHIASLRQREDQLEEQGLRQTRAAEEQVMQQMHYMRRIRELLSLVPDLEEQQRADARRATHLQLLKREVEEQAGAHAKQVQLLKREVGEQAGGHATQVESLMQEAEQQEEAIQRHTEKMKMSAMLLLRMQLMAMGQDQRGHLIRTFGKLQRNVLLCQKEQNTRCANAANMATVLNRAASSKILLIQFNCLREWTHLAAQHTLKQSHAATVGRITDELATLTTENVEQSQALYALGEDIAAVEIELQACRDQLEESKIQIKAAAQRAHAKGVMMLVLHKQKWDATLFLEGVRNLVQNWKHTAHNFDQMEPGDPLTFSVGSGNQGSHRPALADFVCTRHTAGIAMGPGSRWTFSGLPRSHNAEQRSNEVVCLQSAWKPLLVMHGVAATGDRTPIPGGEVLYDDAVVSLEFATVFVVAALVGSDVDDALTQHILGLEQRKPVVLLIICRGNEKDEATTKLLSVVDLVVIDESKGAVGTALVTTESVRGLVAMLSASMRKMLLPAEDTDEAIQPEFAFTVMCPSKLSLRSKAVREANRLSSSRGTTPVKHGPGP